MSTWLSGLKDLTDKVQDVGLKDLTDKVQKVTSKVQAAIPIDSETIQKLTLTTPEMQAERQQMDEEYKHKAAVKDSLSHMFPWETRDEEREILVEECRELIMALSSNMNTFFGPYKVPPSNVNTEKEEKEKTEEEELFEEEDEAIKDTSPVKDKQPSEESLEKLAKLEPLPALLANFDLDAHVGLIKRMLDVDPKLVERQSTLSGGGEREKNFWRNYFFHCAFTRYEAGLSIDEIWSDQPPPQPTNDTTYEEEVTEEVVPTNEDSEQKKTVPSTEISKTDETLPSKVSTLTEDQTHSAESGGSGSSEYEIVDEEETEEDVDVFAGEMDELEAEILKELES